MVAKTSKTLPPAIAAVPPIDIPRRRGRPKNGTTALAKAVYFRDDKQIKELEQIVLKYPRSSMSAVIQQLVSGFCAAHQATVLAGDVVDNKLSFTANIYL